ncbi:non-canonical purine NTP pyrophosphatase [Microlunatus speluncae]|uniref:non-canonical purine NTP pyrophosphatase n=1 Tax=Microlunatus speluncae TaxID=2594267 RepID=UPI0012662E34|nr:non-canonical purine NTP pyrophosphatase [Microlunatus speluncae]
MDSVVLATGNAKKLTELRRLVEAAGLRLTVLGLGEVADYPAPVETEPTFEGNALIKARACVAATGLPSLADDSGLAVDVLNGMPGVRSARWAGPDAADEDNNALLLRQLDDVPDGRRGARFVCAMALVLPSSAERPNGAEHVRTGVMTGQLLHAPVGERGFGYDPLFVTDGQQLSNAELTGEAKDAISHRGQAVRAIIDVLSAELARKAGG